MWHLQVQQAVRSVLVYVQIAVRSVVLKGREWSWKVECCRLRKAEGFGFVGPGTRGNGESESERGPSVSEGWLGGSDMVEMF